MDLLIDRLDSPIGALLLVAGGGRLCALEFEDCAPRLARALAARFGRADPRPATDPAGLATRVRAYLEGDLAGLASIPVDAGGTPFQRRVWSALRAIPPGAVMTYGGLAGQLGMAAASRAVGAANASNPVCIVIPCHRLVGASGALTGYSGGLARKRWLLRHEGADVAPPGPA